MEFTVEDLKKYIEKWIKETREYFINYIDSQTPEHLK